MVHKRFSQSALTRMLEMKKEKRMKLKMQKWSMRERKKTKKFASETAVIKRTNCSHGVTLSRVLKAKRKRLKQIKQEEAEAVERLASSFNFSVNVESDEKIKNILKKSKRSRQQKRAGKTRVPEENSKRNISEVSMEKKKMKSDVESLESQVSGLALERKSTEYVCL